MTNKHLLETIKCPQCGKPKTWNHDNPYRPFCSKRCRLIDLGEWADEKRRVPGEPADPSIPSDEDET